MSRIASLENPIFMKILYNEVQAAIKDKFIPKTVEDRYGHVADELILNHGFQKGEKGGLVVDGVECSADQLAVIYKNYQERMRKLAKKETPMTPVTPLRPTTLDTPAPIQTTSGMKRGMSMAGPSPFRLFSPRDLRETMNKMGDINAASLAEDEKRKAELAADERKLDALKEDFGALTDGYMTIFAERAAIAADRKENVLTAKQYKAIELALEYRDPKDIKRLTNVDVHKFGIYEMVDFGAAEDYPSIPAEDTEVTVETDGSSAGDIGVSVEKLATELEVTARLTNEGDTGLTADAGEDVFWTSADVYVRLGCDGGVYKLHEADTVFHALALAGSDDDGRQLNGPKIYKIMASKAKASDDTSTKIMTNFKLILGTIYSEEKERDSEFKKLLAKMEDPNEPCPGFKADIPELLLISFLTGFPIDVHMDFPNSFAEHRGLTRVVHTFEILDNAFRMGIPQRRPWKKTLILYAHPEGKAASSLFPVADHYSALLPMPSPPAGTIIYAGGLQFIGATTK